MTIAASSTTAKVLTTPMVLTDPDSGDALLLLFDPKWSPDGTRLITSSDDAVQIWSATTGLVERVCPGYTCMAWSPDDGGKRVVLASKQQAWVLSSATGLVECKLEVGLTIRGEDPKTYLIEHVVWSPDGTRVAIQDRHRVWLCSTTTGRVQHTLCEGQVPSRSKDVPSYNKDVARCFWLEPVTWSPDGTRLTTPGYHTGGACIWSATTGLVEFEIPNVGKSLHWLPDNHRVVATLSRGEYAGHVVILSVPPTESEDVIEYTVNARIDFIVVSPDGKHLAGSAHDMGDVMGSMSDTHTLEIWPVAAAAMGGGGGGGGGGRRRDAATRDTAKIVIRHVCDVERVVLSWSPDGTRIASTSEDGGMVRIWSATTGRLEHELRDGHVRGDGTTIFQLVWSPDGTRLATETTNLHFTNNVHSVRIWSVARLDSERFNDVRFLAIQAVEHELRERRRDLDGALHDWTVLVQTMTTDVRIDGDTVTVPGTYEWLLSIQTHRRQIPLLEARLERLAKAESVEDVERILRRDDGAAADDNDVTTGAVAVGDCGKMMGSDGDGGVTCRGLDDDCGV